MQRVRKSNHGKKELGQREVSKWLRNGPKAFKYSKGDIKGGHVAQKKKFRGLTPRGDATKMRPGKNWSRRRKKI